MDGRIAYFQLLVAISEPDPVGVRVRDDAHRSAVVAVAAVAAAEVEQGALDDAAPEGVVQVDRSLLVEEKDPDSACRQGVRAAAAVVAPGLKRMPYMREDYAKNPVPKQVHGTYPYFETCPNSKEPQ